MYTVVIIKPDVVVNGQVGQVLSILEEADLHIRNMWKAQFTPNTAGIFYKEHKDKDFFRTQINFMCSGPCVVLQVAATNEKQDIIKCVRKLIGDTDPNKAEEDTIRSLYGSELPCNAIHASDSEKSAKIEWKFIKTNLLHTQG